MTIVENAYAKINLHLDVTGRLDGGFHRVETVMLAVSLCDTLIVTATGEKDKIEVSGNLRDMPGGTDNLAGKAAMRFFEAIGSDHGAVIFIKKRIPMAAGLAGGSADAAATLRALNRLYDLPLSKEKLMEIAAEIGTDVPFCLNGGTAFADGRGERLHSFAFMPGCAIVVACGGEEVSTPWAYRLLDERWDGFSEASTYKPRGVQALRAAMKSGELSALDDATYNIFEEPVSAERPMVSEIRKRMYAGGAVAARMSGSGPAVFGIFGQETQAIDVCNALQKDGIFAAVCRPLGMMKKFFQ